MEPVIVMVAVGIGLFFLVLSIRRKAGRRVLLNGSAVGLLAIGGYECYMWLVWERRVHAPVRLDILFFELPALLLFLIVGAFGLLPRFDKRK
jgi:hypothetical protein